MGDGDSRDGFAMAEEEEEERVSSSSESSGNESESKDQVEDKPVTEDKEDSDNENDTDEAEKDEIDEVSPSDKNEKKQANELVWDTQNTSKKRRKRTRTGMKKFVPDKPIPMSRNASTSSKFTEDSLSSSSSYRNRQRKKRHDDAEGRNRLKSLREKAQRTDKSTAWAVFNSSSTLSAGAEMTRPKRLPAADAPRNTGSFKFGHKVKLRDDTAGKGWFSVKPSPQTDELKTDLAILRMRNYLDPKRFYKSHDKTSALFDVEEGSRPMVQKGTVIEGPSEFYASRLTKKQRRGNLTEEFMADEKLSKYAKEKSTEIEATKVTAAGQSKAYGRRRRKHARWT